MNSQYSLQYYSSNIPTFIWKNSTKSSGYFLSTMRSFCVWSETRSNVGEKKKMDKKCNKFTRKGQISRAYAPSRESGHTFDSMFGICLRCWNSQKFLRLKWDWCTTGVEERERAKILSVKRVRATRTNAWCMYVSCECEMPGLQTWLRTSLCSLVYIRYAIWYGATEWSLYRAVTCDAMHVRDIISSIFNSTTWLYLWELPAAKR